MTPSPGIQHDGKVPEIPDFSSEFDLDLILNVLQAVCSKHLVFNLFSVCGYHIAEGGVEVFCFYLLPLHVFFHLKSNFFFLFLSLFKC
jgi:hypothetical protein